MLTLLVLTSVALVPLSVQAQVNTQPAVCVSPASPEIAQACKEYAEENAALIKLQSQLAAQKTKSGTLQKDVNSLISQINSTQSKIKTKISSIGALSVEITQKNKAINDLSSELARERASMGQLIKRTNEIDQKGATYVLLSSDSITDFYQDLDSFLSIKQALYASVNKVKEIKSLTENQKEDLEDKQSQAVDAKNALQNEKNKLDASQKQVKTLLDTSKTEEQRVALSVADQQKKVAAIQSKLFSFAGGATKAIQFQEAYAYAKAAGASTGVRSAFILAILTQESNLGKNVGTCNRATDPISKKWQNIMPGPEQKAAGRSSRDDQSAFLRITKALGLDADSTPLSCPIAGGGWGGAMGPSQFIPTTWESIASRVANAVGVPVANPWRARDAIMATALYLGDRGGVGVEANERNAACKYYSGRACDGRAPANSFYGNNVMALTRVIQADIDYLEKYGVSRR